jgi:thymidine phosphorylase
VELGGGRRKLGDPIHPGVGFVLHVVPGQRVERGEPLAEVHAADAEHAERGAAIVREAIAIGEQTATLRPLLSHRVTRSGVELL